MPRLAALALGLAAISFAHAETIPGTNLSIDFQNAYIQGSGANINVYKIPVTDITTGVTTYFDAAFNFTVGANGVTFNRTSYAQISTQPAVSLGGFVVGVYSFSKTPGSTETKYTWTRTPGLTSSRDQLTVFATDYSGLRSLSANLATGPLSGSPFVDTGFQTVCANVTGANAGTFGVITVGDGSYYSNPLGVSNFAKGAPIRVRQLDAKTQQWDVLSSTCGVTNTVIMYLQ